VWSDETGHGPFVFENLMADDSYDFTNVRVRRETAKAFLSEIGDGSFWVPKSQIIKSDGRGSLTTTGWWAQVSGAQAAFENSLAAQSRPPPDLPSASIIFKRLAMKYHPDRNPDAVEFMTDLNELWQAVRKDMKRA
jgi:hypothetical protein